MLTFIRRKFNRLTSDKKFSEILVGSAFALTARVGGTALVMLSSIIIARSYGAEAVGVLAMINSFLMLVTIFTVLGTGTSILRMIPEHVVAHSVTSAFLVYRKTQYLVAAVSLVTGTVFFFASGLVAERVFSKPHLSLLFALASCFVVFKSLMDLNTQAVRGLRLIRTFAIMQVLPGLVMLAFLVGGTVLLPNPDNPVYAQLAAFVVTALVGALIMDRAFKQRMRGDDAVCSVSVREIASTSLPMLMTASMQFFIGQTGVVMLGMFRPVQEVGYYSVAVKLATLTSFVLQAINSMAAPKFSELYHLGKLDDLFHVARKSGKLIFWSSAPILLVLLSGGKQILAVVFGKEFTLAYGSMVLLVLGQFVSSISGSTGNFMNMTGMQKVLRNIMFCSAMINIGLGLVLIPRHGIYGAAISGVTSVCFWNLCALLSIKVRFGRTIGYLPLLRGAKLKVR